MMVAATTHSRLDLWLAADRSISRHAAHTLIEAGAVRINQKVARPGQKVRATDTVEVDETSIELTAIPIEIGDVELNVVYEDAQLAVIDKPYGMVVHPAPGHASGTLADGLRQRGATWSLLGGVERPGIVHRLDRDSSGLLVVAKTEAAHRHLASQLRRRTMKRTYWALVHDPIHEDSGEIHAPIGRHPRIPRRMTVIDSGREAISDFRVLARHTKTTELEVRLRTGRTHQIRVHCAYIHHPIVGDPIYGREDWASRLALHAAALEFIHPISGDSVRFTSELPPQLQEMRGIAAKELRK